MRYIFVVCSSLVILLSNVFAQEMTNPTSLGSSGTVVQEEVVMLAGYDEEFLLALTRMHANGLTKFPEPIDFRPYDLLSRQEASKFFSQFAKEIVYKTLDQTAYCFFDDMNGVDPSLKNYILESCMLHLFGGSAGYFYPFATFTKGQALAVLMRSITGYQSEDGAYWRGIYRQQAREMGLTKDPIIANGDKPVSRYEVALLLYRAAQKIQ